MSASRIGSGVAIGARLSRIGLLGALALGVTVAAPRTARASPYRITSLGAAETWEVKAVGKHKDGGDEQEWSAAIDLTAPIAPGLETSLTFGQGRIEESGGVSRSGMLDTEWAVKWEVVPIRDERSFGVTVEPALIVPTGSNGVGDGEFRAMVPVVVGWDIGKIRLRGLVGYERSLESHDDEISGGLLVEYKLSPDLSLGAEITTRAPSADISEHKDIVDLGFKYEVAKGWELQGRIGQSIRHADHVRERDAAVYLEVAL